MPKKLPKSPEVKNAEITDDGCIIVEFNIKLFPHTAKCVFTPELLYWLADEFGAIPPKEDTDFPGIPVVNENDVYDIESDDEGSDKEENNGP